MKGGKTGERQLGRLGAMAERRADIVYGFPQLGRSREQLRPDVGMLGHARPQPVRLFDGQSLCVPQPLDDVPGLEEVVLMRGKAAAGFRVGEVEREIVGDQGERSGARRGRGNNRHLLLYKLCRAG